MLQVPTAVLAYDGDEDVKPAHAGMTVGGEIEVAIGTEGGEHLVAGGVDGGTHILHTAHAVAGDAHPPDVEATLPTRHVGGEVEPFAVGRDGGMGVTGQRVVGQRHLGGLAPGSVGTT